MTKKSAPNGLKWIFGNSGGSRLGSTAGLTIYASPLVLPTLQLKREVKKKGFKREFFVTVLKTDATDGAHAAYYPGPGLHLAPRLKPGRVGKTRIKYYVDVSRKMSQLIRDGEQEHLDDFARAFEASHGELARAINSLAGKKLGPAPGPTEAQALAEDELAKRLPKALSKGWQFAPLEYRRLLALCNKRDQRGWHSLDRSEPKRVGNKYVMDLETTSKTKIGKVASDTLIK